VKLLTSNRSETQNDHKSQKFASGMCTVKSLIRTTYLEKWGGKGRKQLCSIRGMPSITVLLSSRGTLISPAQYTTLNENSNMWFGSDITVAITG
jgi:hypothetical protein